MLPNPPALPLTWNFKLLLLYHFKAKVGQSQPPSLLLSRLTW